MMSQRNKGPVRGLSFLAFTTSLLLLAIPVAADVDSRINRVTVFPGNLAEVERVARVQVQAGPGEFVFTDLPAALVNGSVRLAVIDGNAVIGGVETRRVPVGESPRELERELQNEIEALMRQQQDALDRVAAASNEITFIEGLAELPKGEKAAEALTAGNGAANWASLWERIGAGSREARQRLRESEREAAELEMEIEVLKKKLAQLGQSRQEVVRVTVPYRAADSTSIDLQLTYHVRGASWLPQYEARLDTSTGKVNLIRSARVSQSTGEDWRDVELALSTAIPVFGERAELSPWWIDLMDEAGMLKSMRGEAMMESPAMLAFDGDAAAPPARTINPEFAATYIIDGQVTVPGGNEPRELPVGSHALAAAISVETLPQTDPRAWLVADSVWNGEGPLPPGKLTRFRDGAYVGEGRLENWAPGEERTLAFGVDPRMEVSFKPLRDEAGTRGWVTTRSTLVRNYRLEVTNRHDLTLPVTALMRIPVARNQDISVKPNYSVRPSENNVNDEQGVHAWKFDLPPAASQSIDLGYEISYPEGKQISGL